MSLPAVIAIKLLECLFVLGSAGSVLVLVLTTIEDFEMLIGSDDPEGKPPKP